MTNTTPRGTQPNVLATEPVTIGGAVIVFGNAVLGALPLFGVDMSADQVGAANIVLAALVALITVIMRHFSRSKASVDQNYTPNEDVVEKIEDQQVVAGPANDLVPEGDSIRDLAA